MFGFPLCPGAGITSLIQEGAILDLEHLGAGRAHGAKCWSRVQFGSSIFFGVLLFLGWGVGRFGVPC